MLAVEKVGALAPGPAGRLVRAVLHESDSGDDGGALNVIDRALYNRSRQREKLFSCRDE
jgi:hypothetical protein